MDFDSYVVSETKIAETLPLVCPPPPYCSKGFGLTRKAFTLAETLITLAIIGVIAAMTVPTLISKYQKHTYVVGLKKAYSQLSNAVKMIPLMENCPAGDYECASFPTYGGIDETPKKTYILSKQFKTVKNCHTNDQSDCSYIRNIFSNAGFIPGDDWLFGFSTQDGMVFGVHDWILAVDVNGEKGPNKVGRDQFAFNINNTSGIVTPQGLGYENNCTVETINNNGYYAMYCTGKVLREDAMNY